MALYEKNLPFESQVVNIQKGEQYESWFLKLNPRGEVPVLQDTGKIIPDSARIIDYLEDNFSNGKYYRVHFNHLLQFGINFRRHSKTDTNGPGCGD